MKKVVKKLFWVWEFDKEEEWLNEMAEKGLVLTSVGFCRYEFEECIPGEYKICMEFFGNKAGSAENMKYIEFLGETGAEYIGSLLRWGYFRKKTSGENFKLFSDNASRIKYLTRIIRLILFVCVANLYIACYNLFLCFYWGSRVSAIGAINLALAAFCAVGLVRLLKKRKKLKEEQKIFE